MSNWLRVSLFLAGLLAGTLGAGGVARYQYNDLEAKYDADHERLVRIENDVKWVIRTMLRVYPE